jgi:excisionase family DNA binding protein
MTRRTVQSLVSRRPLLSVDEVAIELGESRSTIYRALKRGDLPLPAFTINGRLRIPRRAVERLINGVDPATEAREATTTGSCASCDARPRFQRGSVGRARGPVGPWRAGVCRRDGPRSLSGWRHAEWWGLRQSGSRPLYVGTR